MPHVFWGLACEERGVVSVILKSRDIIVTITPPSMITSPTV